MPTKQMPGALKISHNLSLPSDTVTNTVVVYGAKGMGKTNFGSVLAEELYLCHFHFAIIDPMGVWWGLRHGADRHSPGLEVLLLGGTRGDLPIEPTAGAVVADLVVDESIQVVIDISRHANGKMWSRGERIRFVRDYFVRLYERQGESRRPTMQILDEAARFAPQQPRSGDVDVAQCLGAIEQVCEEGRNIGLGLTLLTLRSARLNKAVAELADAMIAFRTVGPNAIGAILDWFGEHIVRQRQKALVEDVRKLPIGTALVCSPGWLQFEGEVAIRPRRTFDSSATPKVGQAPRAPGKAAKPDLAKYRDRMAATIERAQADDPKALRQELRKLKAELARKQPAAQAATKTVPVPVVDENLLMHFSDLAGFVDALGVELRCAEKCIAQIRKRQKALGNLRDKAEPVLRKTHDVPVDRTVPARTEQRSGSTVKGERRILVAIAQRENGATRQQITILTGYKQSTRNRYIQLLQQRDLIGFNGDRCLAKPAAFEVLGDDFEPLPTGERLREHYLTRLPKGERSVFRVLVDNWPNMVTRDQITNDTGYQQSTRNRYLQLLNKRELIIVHSGHVRANDELFPESGAA